MITIVSDFMYYYISDRVLLISGLLLIITLYVFNDYSIVFYRILSGVGIFIVMLCIKAIGNKIFKKESIGDGDIKLMGVIGIALGVFNSFVSLFISAFIGLIFSLITQRKNKEGIIPFGPFILIGSLIVMYFSNILDTFIWNLIEL